MRGDLNKALAAICDWVSISRPAAWTPDRGAAAFPFQSVSSYALESASLSLAPTGKRLTLLGTAPFTSGMQAPG